MRYRLFYIFALSALINIYSQNTKDVGFIKDMPYLEYADRINCDSISGTNLELRVCLNIELREIDSIMLQNFNSFVKGIKENEFINAKDSLMSVFEQQQLHWETKRKSVSQFKSDGYRGHTSGIVFMQSMIFFTRLRINEIEYMQELY
ncbi:hypothetical protein [Winogradskyella sp.]|uniref:hypothetical protein n=1 Tax=Winogradskyella sp. TaxID=1883156 RepID=UPI0026092A99|nr:hypothetical protein [Winogradskyella sp.]